MLIHFPFYNIQRSGTALGGHGRPIGQRSRPSDMPQCLTLLCCEAVSDFLLTSFSFRLFSSLVIRGISTVRPGTCDLLPLVFFLSDALDSFLKLSLVSANWLLFSESLSKIFLRALTNLQRCEWRYVVQGGFKITWY